MAELDDIRADFLSKRPDAWDKLPDLDLYMDQVVSLLGRIQLTPEGSQKLTAAMVNNYVKEGLLPRPKGKRYDRDHLALLQIFVTLKEVVTVKDAGSLLKQYVGDEPVSDGYNALNAMLGAELDEVAAEMPQTEDSDELIEAAMRFALAGYANKMACLHLSDLLSRRRQAETAEGERRKAEKTSDKKK